MNGRQKKSKIKITRKIRTKNLKLIHNLKANIILKILQLCKVIDFSNFFQRLRQFHKRIVKVKTSRNKKINI